eukprot:5248646-Pyramimonas_sp.AAC.1
MPHHGRFTLQLAAALIQGTWQKALSKIRTRSTALNLANLSPTRTAAAWNSCIASVTPYPAHYFSQDDRIERDLRAHIRVSFGIRCHLDPRFHIHRDW